MSPQDSLAVHPDPSERVRQPFQVPLDSAFDRLKMNSSQPSARYHSRWRSWRLHVDWMAQTTLYQVSQAQTAGWVKRNKKNPKLVPARLGAVKLHFRCCRNILDVGLVTRLWLCLTVTVSPVRCELLTIRVRDMPATCDMTGDSDVIEKPSRRWRGAVQQLADVVWES